MGMEAGRRGEVGGKWKGRFGAELKGGRLEESVLQDAKKRVKEWCLQIPGGDGLQPL